jgi:hypothetical protein
VAVELCACGQPLHYTDPARRAWVEDCIARLGPVVQVTLGLRTWVVPRHYIALHGLRAAELPGLGFPEVHNPRLN